MFSQSLGNEKLSSSAKVSIPENLRQVQGFGMRRGEKRVTHLNEADPAARGHLRQGALRHGQIKCRGSVSRVKFLQFSLQNAWNDFQSPRNIGDDKMCAMLLAQLAYLNKQTLGERPRLFISSV